MSATSDLPLNVTVDGQPLCVHDWRLHSETVQMARYRCWYCTKCRAIEWAADIPQLGRPAG